MIVVIPARGGSKGVPKKNIKELNGKPLIEYTLESAREVFEDHQILVSTDSLEIKKVVEKTGLKVPFLRPDILATAKAGTYEVLLHALEEAQKMDLHPSTIVLLQPTSPFRKAIHINEALRVYNSVQSNVDMVVSVKETQANPYYLLKEENESGFLHSSKATNVTRRQDCPKVWELNGAIYIIKVESLKMGPMHKFKKVVKYVMDERSSQDVDSLLDFKWCEFLLKEGEL